MVKERKMNKREKAWIARNARTYLEWAGDFADHWTDDIFEIAQDQVASDIKMAEDAERYELCAKLKKTFEYIEDLK